VHDPRDTHAASIGQGLETSRYVYTCNQPGYFTTEEGWLGEPAGNLAFAGEHTDSFYNFQGFIEGAAVSGSRAAEYLLERIRGGAL